MTIRSGGLTVPAVRSLGAFQGAGRPAPSGGQSKPGLRHRSVDEESPFPHPTNHGRLVPRIGPLERLPEGPPNPGRNIRETEYHLGGTRAVRGKACSDGDPSPGDSVPKEGSSTSAVPFLHPRRRACPQPRSPLQKPRSPAQPVVAAVVATPSTLPRQARKTPERCVLNPR